MKTSSPRLIYISVHFSVIQKIRNYKVSNFLEIRLISCFARHEKHKKSNTKTDEYAISAAGFLFQHSIYLSSSISKTYSQMDGIFKNLINSILNHISWKMLSQRQTQGVI